MLVIGNHENFRSIGLVCNEQLWLTRIVCLIGICLFDKNLPFYIYNFPKSSCLWTFLAGMGPSCCCAYHRCIWTNVSYLCWTNIASYCDTIVVGGFQSCTSPPMPRKMLDSSYYYAWTWIARYEILKLPGLILGLPVTWLSPALHLNFSQVFQNSHGSCYPQ